jgi:AmmeMemoRadiSam system protein A
MEAAMDQTQRRTLLEVARDAVAAAVSGRPLPSPETADPDLNAPCGCFVTLKNADQLRGCIGQFVSDKPLIQLVVEMARAAATSDPRFLGQPITPGEVKDLSMEISVLSPLERTDDPRSLTLGTHGIYIRRGRASGCFLPQVATETGWSVEEFLSFCCSHKAGLPADSWKDPETEVHLFTAEVFGAPLSSL